MKKKKILFIGDGVVSTGFSTVLHNIIGNLPKNKYEVHHLAINYYGDPHNSNWKIYPAQLGGDIWGFGRLKDLLNIGFDGIFILNDPWVLNTYLELIKKILDGKKIPPIIVYFPVDAKFLEPDWFAHFDIVSKCVVYTQFGYTEVKRSYDGAEPIVIPHGVDKKHFHKLSIPTREIKAKVYPHKEEFLDSFIVLNANRNQPRKRIDLTMLGFKYFAENKPENVKLYLHMGIKDMGWDIMRLSLRFGIEKRVVITSMEQGTQGIPIDKLNNIYNATDVGVNTAVGEGWSLVNMEHGVIGKPQIVPDHSALTELYQDCGILIPIDRWDVNQDMLTLCGVIRAESLAEKLDLIYHNRTLRDELSLKIFKKFNDEKYSWSYIVENQWMPLFLECYG